MFDKIPFFYHDFASFSSKTHAMYECAFECTFECSSRHNRDSRSTYDISIITCMNGQARMYVCMCLSVRSRFWRHETDCGCFLRLISSVCAADCGCFSQQTDRRTNTCIALSINLCSRKKVVLTQMEITKTDRSKLAMIIVYDPERVLEKKTPEIVNFKAYNFSGLLANSYIRLLSYIGWKG